VTIHDVVITDDQIGACVARMRAGRFRAADITRAAISAGVPDFVGSQFIAHRVAYRLIQKYRKRGDIRLIDNCVVWTWVGKEAV
jgi:hypothetical protein